MLFGVIFIQFKHRVSSFASNLHVNPLTNSSVRKFDWRYQKGCLRYEVTCECKKKDIKTNECDSINRNTFTSKPIEAIFEI